MKNKQYFSGAGLETILERMSTLAAENAVEGLSTMLGQQIRMTVPNLALVPLSEVSELLGGAEQEAVGIYLMVTGDFPGHVMLIMPIENAFRLVDMLMGVPEGSTQELGSLERSALGEAGNVATSLFLNAIADATGTDLRPSPPAVMMDMVGAIINVIIIGSGAISDDILLLEMEFHGPDRSLEMYFWVVPSAGITSDIGRNNGDSV